MRAATVFPFLDVMDPLLDHIPNIWRAESLALTRHPLITTGHRELDAALGGGWPAPALLEVLCDHEGIGELQLLRALLQPRSTPGSAEARSVVLWLNAPFELQAVAIAQLGLEPAQQWCARGLSERDALWAMEQALRSSSCALVIAWAPSIRPAMLRRLKLAAVSHDAIGVLFRPGAAAAVPSPATLRLRLRPIAGRLQVELLKVQGRRPGCVSLRVDARTQRMYEVTG